jgi:Flp pilus assembly protein TadG
MRILSALRHRLMRSDRSQSVVEFALVAPLFLVLIMGIIDFGLGFGSYVQLKNAAREGARYAVVGNPPGSYPADCTGSMTTSVIGHVCIAVNDLNLADLQSVSVQYPNGQASGNSVVVTAHYRYRLITPLGGLVTFFTGGSFPGELDMSATSDMRLE